MAVPYTAVIKFVTKDGTTFQTPITATDVAAAFWIFPDGSNDFTLPSTHGAVALVDIIVYEPTAATTTVANLFANQKATGEQVALTANLAANVSRQFMGAPIWFNPATRIKFVQA